MAEKTRPGSSRLGSWSRSDWFIIILFAGLVILFYWSILTPNLDDRQSFPPGDFSAQFWAFATFEARELSAGRLPLWNPYTFAGAPFWADVQAAVFYPPSLLTLLLSGPGGFSLFALEIEAIAHFWLAAIFIYLFIRQITASRAAAVIGALTFTFSGYLTGYPGQQLAILEADVWLPLILFFIYRASRKQSDHRSENQKTKKKGQAPIASLLLAGLAWAMTLLAGHPQSALIVAYVSSAYLLFLGLSSPNGLKRGPDAEGRAQEMEDGGWKMGDGGSGMENEQEPESRGQGARDERERIGGGRQKAGRRSIVSDFISRLVRSGWQLLLFLGVGLALAAIQFLPAVEYTLLSVRAEGSYAEMSGGLPITDVIQVLLPGQVSFYSPLYVGVVGLILAGWAAFAAPVRHRHIIFWAVTGLITFLISLGGNTFLYSLLYLFTPGFSIFRGQERWAFAAAFSLSILAAYGFHQLLLTLHPPLKFPQPKSPNPPSPAPHSQFTIHNPQPPIRNPQSLLRLTQSLFLFSLLLTFLFFFGLNDTGWSPDSPFFDLLGTATLLTVILALAWLLWRFSGRLHPTLLIGLAALLICFDLFTANWQTNLYPQLPEWHTRMPAVVEAIKKDAAASPDEPYRVYNEFRLYDNYGVPFQVEDLWGASPLRPRRYDQFLAPPMPIERTWELLNVKYVITWRESLFAPSTIIYQEPADDGMTYVHRLNQVGPRAWLVTQAEIAGDQTILQKIADPNFERWQVALLEPGAEPFVAHLDRSVTAQAAAGPRAVSSQKGNSAIRPEDDAVERSSPHAAHLVYQVASSAPVLLVLSETHYPGWQATLNGQPAPLLRANYMLRAVPVPAGEHRVELTFRPLSFMLGAIISALALMATITGLILPQIRDHLTLWPGRRPKRSQTDADELG